MDERSIIKLEGRYSLILAGLNIDIKIMPLNEIRGIIEVFDKESGELIVRYLIPLIEEAIYRVSTNILLKVEKYRIKKRIEKDLEREEYKKEYDSIKSFFEKVKKEIKNE